MWVHLWRDWPEHREEVLNTWTHGLGFALSLLAALAVATQLPRLEPLVAAGCLVYVLALIAVYAMSTLSHACLAPRPKRRFERLDRAFIYLLIVGTYTPVSLKYFHTPLAWVLLTLMWGLAWYGFATKLAGRNRNRRAALGLHLLLGWLPAIMLPAFFEAVSWPGVLGIVAGGLAYTAGTIFLVWDRRVPHFHAVWHIFVLIGSAAHFATIWAFVIASSISSVAAG